jgi:C4-dicarboxylate transporter DctM subunit
VVLPAVGLHCAKGVKNLDLDLIITIVSFLVLVFLGIPVVFSLGASTLIWMALNIQAMPVMNALPQNMMTYMMRFTFIAMPCFLLVGRMMNKTGVTDRLSDFAVAVLGRFRGGLAYFNVFYSMLFASMSGNAVADAGGIGYVQMTMMKDAVIGK